MSTDASARARETDDTQSYAELEDVLDDLLDEALRKVESGRVYDASNERVRIKWIRIAKDIVAEKRKVVNDRTLEELSERIDEIERRQDDHS
jgi:hypothetical protein